MVSVLNIPESHKLKAYFLTDGDVYKMQKKKRERGGIQRIEVSFLEACSFQEILRL